MSSIGEHAALSQRNKNRKEHFIDVVQRRYRVVHRLASEAWSYSHRHFAHGKACEVELDERVCIRVISRVIVSGKKFHQAAVNSLKAGSRVGDLLACEERRQLAE